LKDVRTIVNEAAGHPVEVIFRPLLVLLPCTVKLTKNTLSSLLIMASRSGEEINLALG
jgi:hypothetical protein